MQFKALTLTSVLALAVLAGCSDAPAAGELTTIPVTIAVEGTFNFDYTQASQPVPNQGTVCVPDAGPSQSDPYKCVKPYTNITGHIMPLPEPDGGGWAVYAKGTGGERQLQALITNEQGMYDFAYAVGEDLSIPYQTLELRMGQFLYATAPMAEATGTPLTLAPITGVTATGTFKGKVLDIEVTGLPADNSTKYTGHLYVRGEDGNVTSAANFQVKAGANHYEDKDGNIADYVEFHIHVGNSKINLFKASLE